MCLGGRSAPPPPPPAPSPPPPRPVNAQSSPEPAESGTTKSEGGVVLAKKKGKSALKIPLISGAGTGVQIQN